MKEEEKLVALLDENPEMEPVIFAMILALFKSPDRPPEEVIEEVKRSFGY